MPGNIELWQQQAAELGLNRQAQKGLLFLCGACGSIGNDKEAVNRRLNWLFPIDPLTSLEDECGGIYDGKIVSLLEEMLFHLGAQIEFREIMVGEVCIKALTPQNHGALEQEGTHQLTMFSVNGLYSSFLEQLGIILEESNFDDEHCHLSGMFFLQVNYQADVHGFINTFRFLEQAMSPVYRYLIDMPSIGSVDQLCGFLPFHRVLYGFISGMPQETVEPLWSLQSYIFYKDDSDGELAAQFLSPNHFMERTISSIDKYIDECPGTLESLRVEEMLPQSALTIDQSVEMFTHIGRVVSQEWGGDISSYEMLNSGSKLMLNVCVFYAVTAIKVANLSPKEALSS